MTESGADVHFLLRRPSRSWRGDPACSPGRQSLHVRIPWTDLTDEESRSVPRPDPTLGSLGRVPGARTRSVGCSGIAQPAAAAPSPSGRPSHRRWGEGPDGPARPRRIARCGGVGGSTSVPRAGPAGNSGIDVATAGRPARRSATGTGRTGPASEAERRNGEDGCWKHSGDMVQPIFPFPASETLTEKRTGCG